MKLAEIMHTDLITVVQSESLNAAIRLLKDHDIKHLPVLEDTGELVGIITDRDLKRASPSDATLLEVHELLYLMDKVKLSEVMTKSPITAKPEMQVPEAAKLMAEKKVGCLPVTKADKLIGIVTVTDFLKLLANGAGYRARFRQKQAGKRG